MDALTAYRSVLRELDKHNSPTFSVGTFNWFFGEAIDDYITKNYVQGDVYQKELDDISVVVVDDTALTQNVDKTLFDKPANYRHLLYLNVVAKALATYRNYTLNQQVTFVIRRQRMSRRGYQEENAYERPSDDNPRYRISNEKIKVLLGSKFEPVSAKLMYIRIPNSVYLNPDPGADFNNPANNTVLEFPGYVCKEIVRWCARLFLENIQSPRYQTVLAERSLKKE